MPQFEEDDEMGSGGVQENIAATNPLDNDLELKKKIVLYYHELVSFLYFMFTSFCDLVLSIVVAVVCFAAADKL